MVAGTSVFVEGYGITWPLYEEAIAINLLATEKEHTGKTLIVQLDKFRKKRNISEYDRIGMISAQEADEMVDLAGKLRQQVQQWLADNYPDLI